MELVPNVPEEPQCMTLDQAIERLQKIRESTPGEFHLHLCSEHPFLRGAQIQEGIKDIAVSNRQGVVIMLAESFR